MNPTSEAEVITDLEFDSCLVGRPIDQVDRLLLLVNEINRNWLAPEDGTAEDFMEEIITQLAGVRVELQIRDQEFTALRKRSESLAEAQADAIVRSAEIIDELEQTKRHLSEARAAAEKAAHDTQRLADTVFERTNDGVLILANGVCIASNENALQLLGSSRDDLIGNWPAAFDAAKRADCTSAEALLRDSCANVSPGESVSLEVILRDQIDFRFWAEITMSAFDMNDDEHVLAVVRDITARKQFETELKRHRDFLENIINAVPDQLAVNSTDDRLVLANDAFCKAHQISRAELDVQAQGTVLSELESSRFEELNNGGLEVGECTTSERELFDPRGNRSVLSVKQTIFEDETAGDRYVVSTARDVTEARDREDQLRLLASVFNGASEGVAILSQNGQIREANPAFQSMNSTTRALEGESLSNLIALEKHDLPAVLARVSLGESWSGKATSRNGNLHRSYWVSLSRPQDSDQQLPRIIALVSDITELENVQDKLRKQALYDNLTGLPNRRFFRDYVQNIITEARSTRTGVSVCFLDLDDFKHVNDTAGHAAGDHLLIAVGERIQEVVRDKALVARFGGDEFALVFADSSQRGMGKSDVLRQLLTKFRDPFNLGEAEAVVGLSIGVTSFPRDAKDVETLMCNADIAMYAAKTAGKNQLREFTSEMQDEVNLRHQVETRLRKALYEEELSLRLQPKVTSDKGKPVGCEALVRWRTSDGQFISPGDFIPIAEQTGLILPLGEAVFYMAALEACKLFDRGLDPSIAVNISPVQLRHPKFIDQLQGALQDTGAKAEWFELEITEHAMMGDVEHAITIIRALAELGFRIAVDDFGTGYCSLSYLKNFQIHTLKIDMSFVQDINHDPQSLAIVQTIVSLGDGLELNTVAEGVETSGQVLALQSLGCKMLQGYHIGKPMTPEDYRDWLIKRSAIHVD